MAETKEPSGLERLEKIAPYLMEVAGRPEVAPAADFLRKIAEKASDVFETCKEESEAHARNLEEVEERMHDAEDEAEFVRERWAKVDELLEDLKDIERGVRDFDEVFAKWKDGISIE